MLENKTRILGEKSFDEMGKIYNVTSEKIKTLFAVVLWKIQKYIQPNIGHLIVKRNTLLEQEQQNQEQAYPFYFNRILAIAIENYNKREKSCLAF